MIIAVDGLAGSGKGTLCKALAEKYNMSFLDTGILYRMVAYEVEQKHVSHDDLPNIIKIANSLSKIMPADNIKSDKIGILASKIAKHEEVRKILTSYIRNFAKKNQTLGKSTVLDGRDIGSKVLPNADLKIFITAKAEIRAERRLKELQSYGIKAIYDNVLQEIKSRDNRDSKRINSPMTIAEGAVVIDTCLSPEKTVDLVSTYIDRLKH